MHDGQGGSYKMMGAASWEADRTLFWVIKKTLVGLLVVDEVLPDRLEYEFVLDFEVQGFACGVVMIPWVDLALPVPQDDLV